MKPTQERRNQFLNHLWDYIQDEDTNSGRLLLDRLIDLIDERIDERLAKPPIPEPERPERNPLVPHILHSEFHKDLELLQKQYANAWGEGSLEMIKEAFVPFFEKYRPLPEFQPGRPTTNSQEKEFREEAGKPENIIPAGPLKVMPEEGDWVYCAHILSGTVHKTLVEDGWICGPEFEAGRLFPPTPEGKLGAELRAKRGVLPPIDREELEEKLHDWHHSDSSILKTDSVLIGYLGEILEGGDNE